MSTWHLLFDQFQFPRRLLISLWYLHVLWASFNTTVKIQYRDRHGNCFLKLQFEKYLLLYAWERYSSIAYMKQLAPIQRTVILAGCLGLLYFTRMESHHTSISLSMALRAMAAEPEVLSLLNCLFVPWGSSSRVQTPTEQCENGQAKSLSQPWQSLTPRWDSPRRVPLELPILGQGRLLLGLWLLFRWSNHLRDSFIIIPISLTAFQTELWATLPHTHQVSSKGRIAGKWVQQRRGK